MTDNEIIKALECCGVRRDCAGCPKEKEPYGCYFVLCGGALDLINRLKAENDELFYKLQGVMWFVDKWLDGDELKQDEVSRATIMREKTLQITEKLQAEVEGLQKRIVFWREDLNYQPEKVRAEAIKEFAERLKDLLNFYDPKCKFVHIHIDNLVKEMTKQRKEDEGK